MGKENYKFMPEEDVEKLLKIELPNLIHRILHITIADCLGQKELMELVVKEIKKITNIECESISSYFKKSNIA